MNTYTLSEPRFASTFSNVVRIPKRVEIGAEPGITFELGGPSSPRTPNDSTPRAVDGVSVLVTTGRLERFA
jgi:hypothetical protein